MTPSRDLGRREFIALVSSLIGATALSIDLVLPSFSEIRTDFGISPDSNSATWIITAFFLGLAFGQPLYGPITDRFGRRSTLYIGIAIHASAAIATSLAPSLGAMLVLRFIWGLGAAGIRVTATAMVRDRYEGAEMARAMSFIMSVFMVVPVMAPTLGAGILQIGSWRWTFAAGAVAAIAVGVWALRMPETLDPADRGDLRFGPVLRAARTVVSTRQTLGYTLAQTFAMGGFLSFLASSELIFSELYDQKDRFPQLFGLTAATMAAGTLSNARLAARVDLRVLVRRALVAYVTFGIVMIVVVVANDGLPPLWLFMLTLLLLVGTQAVLIPNFAALAMAPVGHLAGMASAITGTIFMGGGALLGSILDGAIGTTVTPLAVGFTVYGTVALLVALWTQRSSGTSQGSSNHS
ncbi:MAG: DHA1 family bicyclomycin/chloramphenicol resistance-like MFS transporter [Acidimicrobiales bacterium]|jgi:MFS transporter, DHA1 family, multidrug resistance protein